MTQYQADQLMGVLPDPDKVKRASGGGLDLGPGADKYAVDLINGAAPRMASKAARQPWRLAHGRGHHRHHGHRLGAR